MGQFKPMVKMFTDEPSVMLKLKKGGKVKGNAKMAAGQSEGFKSMANNSKKVFEDAPEGVAPKKPSMAARRRAMKAEPTSTTKPVRGGMSASLMKDGGKTKEAGKKDGMKHMRIGGFLRPTPMTARSMGNPAGVVSQYNPMPAQVHPMVAMGQAPAPQRFIPYSGVRYRPRFAEGGETKAMHKAEMSKMKGLEKELKSHESKPAGKAHKGLKTGGVAMGQGGYKKGGKVKMAEGGLPKSGIIKTEGQGGEYRNTKMHTAKPDHAPAKTGEVKLGNGGGYKHGGKAMKYASGGEIDSKLTRTTVEGGNWENRPANTSKPGKSGTKTGEVKKSNAGGYKHGGNASKKHYATGGNVVDDGKAVKMPRHFISLPVANSMQSGTFKRGGKVKRHAEGGLQDASKGAYDKSIGPSESEMDMAKAIRSVPRRLYEGAKSLFGGAEKAPGSVTKTKESVTVTPAKKRGGSMKC